MVLQFKFISSIHTIAVICEVKILKGCYVPCDAKYKSTIIAVNAFYNRIKQRYAINIHGIKYILTFTTRVYFLAHT